MLEDFGSSLASEVDFWILSFSVIEGLGSWLCEAFSFGPAQEVKQIQKLSSKSVGVKKDGFMSVRVLYFLYLSIAELKKCHQKKGAVHLFAFSE
ncbi:MAG: hypothetical protein EA341_13025 [Mongoliibacter sp.]|nr:MAG: hypothetical protein EA341_13025 [Mongoliibacter sp.]